MQLRRYRIKMQRIKIIFISHLHGDHYFGLPGLLNSLHLLGRKTPMHVFSPPGLKAIIDLQMAAGGGRLQYPVTFTELNTPAGENLPFVIYSDEKMQVEAFPLKHRIPCFGFLFRERQRELRYLPEQGVKYGVGIRDIPGIKKGQDFVTASGERIANTLLTKPPGPVRTYAYCTDTLPLKATAKYVAGANSLYHEATFMNVDAGRAKDTLHSTAQQAGEIALEAGVGRLLLGHFSARYRDLEPLLAEAHTVFAPTELALEGATFEI